MNISLWFRVHGSWLLTILLCGCSNQQLYKDKQIMMGTFVEVVSSDKRAAHIAFGEIKRIEGLLSKYNPESEIAKLNKSGKLKVSADTFYIIKKAKEFWQLSGGAFDISVAPLADLWGFSDKKFVLPKREEIKKILSLVGSDKIILTDKDNVVEFKLPGMKIDLGAIAKGYAVDCAVNKLKEAGIKNCLINAGGQIYCLGSRFGRAWTIAIRDPHKAGIIDYLELKDKAVATSGDYEQYFTRDNKRYSHIFDPQSGYPADSGVVSVTVVSQEGLAADALSTSIFVLGKAKGMELARKFPGVEVKIIP